MSWVDHVIWWHVYPLGFTGAPIREEHGAPEPRLRHLIGWLDHAVELGCSGLLLGPIFASETHGYDSTDLLRIDPRLGDEEDFDALVSACKQRGLHLLLDGVFSHVGAEHPELRAALAEGPNHPAAQLFDIDWEAPGGPAPRVFEGHSSLARLNHSSPATVRHVTHVLNHWLDRGVDGWRLDAAYSVAPEFWAEVIPAARDAHPRAWFLGEVLHGDYVDFVARSRIDSLTQYELWKAIWSSLNDRNFFELDWALQRHNGFLDHFLPQTFIGNHDVTRIASRIGNEAAVCALALLMTLGGVPSIYYGDEQAFAGIKEDRLGGDDEIRPAFPGSPAELSPLGAHVLRAHQDLIGLRRRHPWLVRARTTTLQLDNTRYRYLSSACEGQHLEVELDITDSPQVWVRDPHGAVLWSFS
ncbi:MAG: alpha-amylase family protein [Propionibacteriaceae bacterium]|nr:alpha-amylase family protein [Propionibacteriaceae bacterium]